jgi:hypothetical protein
MKHGRMGKNVLPSLEEVQVPPAVTFYPVHKRIGALIRVGITPFL